MEPVTVNREETRTFSLDIYCMSQKCITLSIKNIKKEKIKNILFSRALQSRQFIYKY